MLVLITGKPGVGKTHIVKLLTNDGYESFVVDDFIKKIYKKNNIGYIVIKQKLGDEFVDDYSVDTKKVLEFACKSRENFKKLTDLIWPIIKDKLINLKKENKFVIVEMSIYLLNREFFSNIFDKVIIIDRANNLLFLNETQQKFLPYYNEKLYKDTDLIISNNQDILQCYAETKTIINKIIQRISNSLYRPIDDGYYPKNNNVKSVYIIWPSIYNFQFSIEIKQIENTFIDAISSICKIIDVNVGVDLISYENVKNFLPSNINLFRIHLFPFSINKELLVFLENRVDNDTRVLISKNHDNLYSQLFKNYYLNYTFPFKISNNDFMVINNTLFIIESKYEIIGESYGYSNSQIDNIFKLFFCVDDVIVIKDDEGSNDNNIYKYMNYFNGVVFYSFDEKHRVDIFESNKNIITNWAYKNNLRTEEVKIIIFDDYCWLSYTNFVDINNSICIISLCEINDILFLKKIKQLKLNTEVIIIDGSLYQANYYFSINSIVLKVPELKF